MEEPGFRTADANDVDAASATLARAFVDYPWTQWVVADDNHLDRIERIQAICLRRISLPHGLVAVNPDCTAVAAFTSPNALDTVDPQVWSDIATAAGKDPSREAAVALPAPQVPNSWELATVGVAPECQGMGLGRAAIEYGLRFIDRIAGRQAPVHLETSDERNLRLYERCGFEAYGLTEIPDGPRVWSMQR